MGWFRTGIDQFSDHSILLSPSLRREMPNSSSPRFLDAPRLDPAPHRAVVRGRASSPSRHQPSPVCIELDGTWRPWPVWNGQVDVSGPKMILEPRILRRGVVQRPPLTLERTICSVTKILQKSSPVRTKGSRFGLFGLIIVKPADDSSSALSQQVRCCKKAASTWALHLFGAVILRSAAIHGSLGSQLTCSGSNYPWHPMTDRKRAAESVAESHGKTVAVCGRQVRTC